jgi:hypothetical protein
MGTNDPSTPAWRRATLAFGAMVVVFGTVAILLDTGTEGHVVARERTTVEVHSRMTVVLEAGAELEWHLGPGGVADAVQPRGEAIYRVPEGPPVHLRAGKLQLEVHDAVVRLRHVDGEVEAHTLLGRARARSGPDRWRVDAGWSIRTSGDGLAEAREIGLGAP